MEFGPVWAGFINDIEVAVRSESDDAAVVKKVTPLLSQFLEHERSNAGAIPARFKQSLSAHYAQYLLYKSEDNAVCVVSVVWSPGQVSPVHDHGTWGVIGVLQNRERETTYLRVDDRSREGYAELQAAGTRVVGPGDITEVLPPDDIHRVGNAGQEVAISVHVYGADIGSRIRRVFDLEGGTMTPFVSGYARPE